MASLNQLTIAVPSPAATGDLMVVGVISDQAITIPGGWTSFRAGMIGVFHYSISHRTLGSGDLNGTFTWNLGAITDHLTWFNLTLRGVTGQDGFLATDFTSPVTTITAPSITTTQANDIVILLWLCAMEDVITLPAITHQVAGMFASGNISMSISAFQQAAAGATGAQSATLDTASTGVGVQAAVSGASLSVVSMGGGALG